MKFVIHGRLLSLNDLIRDSRTHYHKANNAKKKAQKEIMLQLPKVKVTKYPVEVWVTFFEPDNCRDCDGITGGGLKVLMDALVNKGILIDDSRKYVRQIHPLVYTDRNNPRIEIEIKEELNNQQHKQL